jgi:hypothetical protein
VQPVARRRRLLDGAVSASLAATLLLGVLATQQSDPEPGRSQTLTPQPPAASTAPAPPPVRPLAAPRQQAPRRPVAPAPAARRKRGPGPVQPVAAPPRAVPAYAPMDRGYRRDAHDDSLCPAGPGEPLGLTCRSAEVVRGPGEDGYVVRFQVCPTSTARFDLHFATEAEVAMRVLDSGGRPVWTWRPAAPYADNPHVLVSEVGACWLWETPWRQVDDAGRPLRDGRYSLQVDFLEVEDTGTYSRRFDTY